MSVIRGPIVEWLSLLIRASSSRGEKTVKSSGPLTEKKPSRSGKSGRSTSPCGSGCGFPDLPNETRLKSRPAGGGLASPIATSSGVGHVELVVSYFLLVKKKKNLHVIHEESCTCCCYVI